MKRTNLFKKILKFILPCIAIYLLICIAMFFLQRSMLYFPSHVVSSTALKPWTHNSNTIGYCREVKDPQHVWLMMHGNAGNAADRGYVLARMSEHDSLYVMEYPGYGSRAGKPGQDTPVGQYPF